eukprot:760208-Hanusia_phi.AAC.2
MGGSVTYVGVVHVSRGAGFEWRREGEGEEEGRGERREGEGRGGRGDARREVESQCEDQYRRGWDGMVGKLVKVRGGSEKKSIKIG